MEVLKDINGWKLYREKVEMIPSLGNSWRNGIEDRLFIMNPDGYKTKLPNVSKDQALKWLEDYSNKGWFSIEMDYYYPSVIKNKIHVAKFNNKFVRSDKIESWKSNKFLTKEEAKEAIEKIYPEALDKFKKIKLLYETLTKENEFNIGFNYDGDGDGIYNEYQYVNFKMGGFDFEFVLGE